MLITGEGKNKTEQLYFSSFNEQHGNYVIRFVKTGLDTDPSRMLRSMKKAWTANGLNTKNGDKAYIVLDLDCDPQKIQKISNSLYLILASRFGLFYILSILPTRLRIVRIQKKN